MSESSPRSDRPSAWPLAISLLLLSFAYLFSYAPVVRMHGGWKIHPSSHVPAGAAVRTYVKEPIDGDNLPMYQPVDWLIDHTPFQDPLLWWARKCGVGSPFSEGMGWRRAGTTPSARLTGRSIGAASGSPSSEEASPPDVGGRPRFNDERGERSPP